MDDLAARLVRPAKKAAEQSAVWKAEAASAAPPDPVLSLLGRQLASGLWDEPDTTADDEVRRARATARALLELIDLGVSSSHPMHGAQVKKAIEALLQVAPSVAERDPQVAQLALGVAYLAASGPRTRRRIESAVDAIATLAGLRVWLADEHALRARLDQLSAA
jgi:Ca-activated chloride channel family protein